MRRAKIIIHFRGVFEDFYGRVNMEVVNFIKQIEKKNFVYLLYKETLGTLGAKRLVAYLNNLNLGLEFEEFSPKNTGDKIILIGKEHLEIIDPQNKRTHIDMK